MSTLVIGAMEEPGMSIVRGLVARRERVQALSSSTAETDRLPNLVEGVLGDLSDLLSLRIIFEGTDRVVLVTPHVPDQTRLGMNAVIAARAAGVDKLVFVSSYRAEDFPDVLHLATKLPIERALRESRMPWTVVRAGALYQDDAPFRETIVERGIYPLPIGRVGDSRVDARDVADVVLEVLNDADYDEQTVSVVGPEAQTGEGIAKVYSELLDRPVRYAGDDPSVWEEQAKSLFSDWLVRDYATMWEELQRQGRRADPEDLDHCRQLLGREPRRFEDYATELLGSSAYRPHEISESSAVT